MQQFECSSEGMKDGRRKGRRVAYVDGPSDYICQRIGRLSLHQLVRDLNPLVKGQRAESLKTEISSVQCTSDARQEGQNGRAAGRAASGELGYKIRQSSA
jgi:hypothetical protein